MKREFIGTSTLASTRLAYGCWRIGGSAEPGTLTPDVEAQGRQAVIAAYEAGYALFDHANIYCHGLAESIFGRVLKEVSGMRNQVAIASKCGIRKAGDPEPNSPYRFDFSARHIVSSCEQSLKRLGVDTIDLYQLHRPDFLCDPEEVAGAFVQLKESGKVREFGVSNFKPSQIVLLQKACPMPLIVNQIEISLMKLDAFTDGTIDYCMTEKVRPMAWSPLARGKLGAGANDRPAQPPPRAATTLWQALDAVAHARGTRPPAVALAWLLKHPSRIIPIVGSTNPDHIREATKAADLDLTREEWYRLFEAASGQRLP